MKSPSAVVAFLALLLIACAPAGCKREKKQQPDAGTPAAATPDDDVDPVYPVSIAPHPLAAKLCAALHDLPAKRAAACCEKSPGLVLTSECTRMLSGALSLKAVTLTFADVDRCVTDLEKAHEGCGWVGGAAQVPASCRDLVDGSLAKGIACRSTLECEPGLRCQGVGPTDAGVCFPSLPAGAPCETSVDSLVSFAKQTHVLRLVPECEGACEQHRCQPPVAAGGACRRTEECGPGNRCAKNVCVPGAVAASGESCAATPDCVAGLRCIAATCAAPKPEGAACMADGECLGACVKKEPASSKEKAGSGVCSKRC